MFSILMINYKTEILTQSEHISVIKEPELVVFGQSKTGSRGQWKKTMSQLACQDILRY